MTKALFIVGSLRKESFNLDLAKKAEKLLKEKNIDVDYLDYTDVPLMNQDLETPVLPQIKRVRDEVEQSDFIWIFSPVYNSQIPGTVKNLLDWLSRALDLSDTRGPSIVNNKKVSVSVVSSVFQDNVLAQYEDLLTFIRMNLIGKWTPVKIDAQAWTTGQLTLDEDTQQALNNQVETIINELNK